ncbi:MULTISPECIES: ribosomal protein L7/L12 [unclassified Psychrobacter]|uniref:ribosomal protein L7/L12 n=1 Tax=unclassified Psychrobacter TaxID=196806 RepID=UPI003F449326
MANLFNVSINRVPLPAQKPVTDVLKVMLGPDAIDKINQLLDVGGFVLGGLNEQAADVFATKLREAGATVSIELSNTTLELFRVRLLSFGEQKLQVIKQVREITGLGLKEAKTLVESNGVVKDNLDKPSAIKVHQRLSSVGATVVIEAMSGSDNGEDPKKPKPAKDDNYLVTGKVSLANGKPASGVLIRAYDKDLRSEQYLGEASISSTGDYAISYKQEQFSRSEKNNTDLLLRVFNEVGIELALKTKIKDEPDIFFNSPKKMDIDLQLEASAAVKASEYERLEGLLRPALDSAVLADLSLQDISFLINETEINEFSDEFPAGANSIHFIAQSAKLSYETNIPAAAFYGWARMEFGLVRNEATEQPTLNLDTLLEQSDKYLTEALKQAIAKIIIPAWLAEQIDLILSQLQRLRDEKTQQEKDHWILHEVKGVLIDSVSAEPLVGLLVNAQPLDEDRSLHLQGSITNGQGEFILTYALPPESTLSNLSLVLNIEASNGDELDEQEVSLPVEQKEAVIIKITVPVPIEPGEALQLTALPITFSNDLNTFLKKNNLTNIAELRKLGNLETVKGLPETLRASDEVRQLQAQVDLSLLSTDLKPAEQIKQNQLLIDKGFASFSAIADMPVEQFVSVIGNDGIVSPAIQHAQARYLDFQLANAYLDIKTGGTNNPEELQQDSALSCQCEDCVSALSPGAYLTDLIGYVTSNVTQASGTAITLDFLVDNFHQPLSKLPINCAATKTQLRQVRIACEVLLAAIDTSQLNFVITDERVAKYRQAAYQSLLRNIGTSQFDLDRASSDADIEAIANRLGIDPNYVKELQLQSGAHQILANALSEHNLERIFGLPAYMETYIDIDIPRVRLLDPLRFLKAEQKRPELYDWRLERLKKQWKEIDFPESPLSQNTPIIDPDVIGPDDFRHPDELNTAFELWKTRREWVDEQIARIHSKVISDSNNPYGLATAIAEITVPTTLGNLIAQQALLANDAKIIEDATFTQWLSERQLSVEALNELARFATDVEVGKEYNEEEWQTYVTNATNIIVNSVKRAAYNSWVLEEANISLNMTTFWPSLTEPQEGEWSLLLESEKPLLDPENIEPKKLPDGKFALTARTLWDERRIQLNEKQKEYADILKSKTAGRLDAIMSDAFGTVPDIENINTKLNSLDQAEQSEAKAQILALNLDQESFITLVSASLILKGDQQTLSNTVQNNLSAALVSAYKFNLLYQDWLLEEARLPYWQSLKARLPRWRASQLQRQQWQQTLKQASTPPLIDPDVISGDVLIEPIIGNFAYDTWRSRTKLIDIELNTIRDSIEQNGNVTDDVIKPDAIENLFSEEKYLGISHQDLIALSQLEEKGVSITSRLQQIALVREAYLFLLDVAKRIEKGSKVLAGTRENMYAILLQIWKIKQFATWREEEKSRLSLSPEFFKYPTQRPTFTVQQEAQKWRIDTRRQREWYRTLKARIDQQEVLASSLKSMVSEVEEQTLPLLRNALVNIIDPSSDDLTIKSEKLTKRFLIDLQQSGCQMTTRVSMALEVLQTLVFSIRSGKIDIADVELKISSKQFEQEWRWMGSYATWKAAMGVFFYPEQILYPSLREEQTSEFSRLTSNTLNQLSPKDACKISEAYYEYLKDISALEVKATCWGSTSIKSKQECFTESISKQKVKDLFYLFGINNETKHCYWSTFDLKAQASAALAAAFLLNVEKQTFQSSWQHLPIGDVNVTDIVGATTYQNKMYVVLRIIVKEKNKLGSLLYDLETNTWSELVELGIPSSPRGASFTMVQQDLMHNEPQPPTICCLALTAPKKFSSYKFSGSAGYIYYKENIDNQYSSVLYTNTLTKENTWVNNKWTIITYLDHPVYQTNYIVGEESKITSAVQYKNGLLISVNIEKIYQSSTSSNSSLQGYIYGIKGSSLTIGLSLFSNQTRDLDDYLTIKSSIKTKSSYLNDVTGRSEKSINELRNEIVSLEKKKESIISEDDYTKWLSGRNGPGLYPIGALRIDSSKKNVTRLHVFSTYNLSYDVEDLPDSDEKLNDFASSFNVFLPEKKLLTSSQNNKRISLATHNGKPILNYSYDILYNIEVDTNYFRPVYSIINSRTNTGLLDVVFKLDIAPNLQSNPIQISTETNIESQQYRRNWIHENSVSNDYANRGYLDEAYYYLPVWIAEQLSRYGHYKEALEWYSLVFDYKSTTNRKISWVLQQEDRFDHDYNRNSEWPVQLNPHAFAQNRKNTYTHFTIQSIIRCLLDYADAEFTYDTSESVARARNLYNTALELIESELPVQPENKCSALIESLKYTVEDITLQPYYEYLKSRLGELNSTQVLKNTLVEVRNKLNSNFSEEKRLANALEVIQMALGERKASLTATEVITKSLLTKQDFSRILLSNLNISTNFFKTDRLLSRLASLNSNITDNDSAGIETVEIADFSEIVIGYSPRLSFEFCIPNNPTVKFLLLRAKLNLFKIRNCMNIAGMQRELEPYSAPIDVESALPSMGAGGQINLASVTRIRPTQYRYPVLVDRAKQLTHLAQQTEASFFSTLQSLDQEKYTLFKARQDVELSREGVKLQKLRVRESENGLGLAELQLERTAILVETYAEWSSEDMLDLEKQLLDQYKFHQDVQILSAFANYASHIAGLAVTAAAGGATGGAPASAAAAAAIIPIYAETVSQSVLATSQFKINTLSQSISIALRNREYQLQHQLAEQDVQISNQQIKLANDRIQITEQEQAIAEIQSEQASGNVIFLQEKFTNVELYDWMSGVLKSIFRYYLQQAAAMSKLAEIQLAFERQEPLFGVIKDDYYELPNFDGNNSASSDSATADRRGLTGSARLLRDITKLDQYAFTTDQRKQQLSVNFSLSQLDPFAFQQFKQTGILNFDTSGKVFDRRFPGQYLRLIKQVRISVIALVPPVQGISATLTSSGISRVVIAGDVFQTVVIRRDPESIAFSNPIGASGVFELSPNPEMLLPFEGNGVDTRWEFRLPEASNPMDFNTIADVLLTIEYTALHDRTYQQQIQQELDTYTSFDRAFSFRQEFSDAWYDLHNPEQTDTPMSVSFETTLADFPSNINELIISHVLMYFIADSDLPSVFAAKLFFTQHQDSNTLGGEASPIDGVIRSNTNGTNWAAIGGSVPKGKWQLELPNIPVIKQLFSDEKINDILLVLTCEGELPSYLM